MKKLFALLALLFVAFALVGCGGNNNNGGEQGPAELSDKVLAADPSEGQVGYFAVGGYGSWDPTAEGESKNQMEATSLKALGEIDKALAEKLAGKNVVELYIGEVTVGQNASDWSKKAFVDGKIYKYSGSFVGKFIRSVYDEDDNKWPNTQWIPDPHTAHVEVLTPATYWVPVWTEESDEHGFSWADDSVVIGEAGTYYVVVAKYNAVSAPEVCGYGIAYILKEKGTLLEGEIWHEEVVEFVWSDHTYGIVGTINGWKDDIAMVGADGEFTAEVELTPEDEIKVRCDGNWDVKDWGKDGGNIKVAEAGTYIVKLSFVDSSEGELTVTKK